MALAQGSFGLHGGHVVSIIVPTRTKRKTSVEGRATERGTELRDVEREHLGQADTR